MGNGKWSAENGNLAKCLCKFKVYFKFLWIFCFKFKVCLKFLWIFLLYETRETDCENGICVDFSPFYKRLKMTKQATNPLLYCLICCRTERSEVSINSKVRITPLKRVLNSLDFSPFYKRLKMTMRSFFVLTLCV